MSRYQLENTNDIKSDMTYYENRWNRLLLNCLSYRPALSYV